MKTKKNVEHMKLVKNNYVERTEQALRELAVSGKKPLVGFALAGVHEDGSISLNLGGQCIDNGMSALKASARLYLTLLAEHS